MASYYANPELDSSGVHEVHRQGCFWLSLISSPVYLGQFEVCRPAVAEARRRRYVPADGCFFCSRECHTR